jgi:hypothetical protein
MANMPFNRNLIANPRYLILAAGLSVVTLLLLYGVQTHYDDIPSLRSSIDYVKHTSRPTAHCDITNIQNRTLGFQEVKVISLPERTDKHDSWAVAASVFGLDYTLADGVDADSISPKALPYTMNKKPTVVACWRAHMDVLQDMVNRNVASTLIFEDDADWDVSLRSQLTQFARGSRWLLNSTSSEAFDSPYGPDWDMLWIGNCGANVDPWDRRRFVIPNDPSAVPAKVFGGVSSPDMRHWKDQIQTRVIMSQHDGTCTASYAISLAGARKVLYHMSMQPYDAPVDWGYADMCREKKSGFNCIAPYPTIVGVYRPAGSASKSSDIEESGDTVNEEAKSGHLVYSLRMNLDRLLTGQSVMKASKDTSELTGVQEMDIDSIGRAIGHEQIVDDLELDESEEG